MKKILKLIGKVLGGFLLLIIGILLLVVLLLVRLVAHIVERILFYPHKVFKILADGSSSLLKSFVTGYESAARKKRREMRGVVIGGVSSEERPS